MIALEAATHTALSISPNRRNFLCALAAAAAVGHSFFGFASMDETGPDAGEEASFNSLHTPKSWAEKAYPKLIHYNRLPKGGHFAAWEQSTLFSDELRESFRSLRQ
jgi:pimeloyl-ACP methyl ester carboxylesterase